MPTETSVSSTFSPHGDFSQDFSDDFTLKATPLVKTVGGSLGPGDFNQDFNDDFFKSLEASVSATLLP